ncbi:hypothetical protein DLAC_04600 [Tieghemostelium lacteum]|uniref:DUF3592 domain-containing protein n=1 Tax=Tieghemostelium lacteum TaxID=361077 RepID=A0A151ZJX3_TIELA|nr:hypothetical protein DLAC_04600 [Tieghemostelium lacteum]|eukprot:KYQ94301.1 hypothetical protein DLAC_04600 [Tieghemostelium lacteum]
MFKQAIVYCIISALFTLMMFLLLYYAYINPVLKIREHYIPTECTVVDKTAMKVGNGYQWKYIPIVSVTYVTDGQAYDALCNDGYYLYKSSIKHSKVSSYLDGYDLGSNITCLIDPDQSDHCVLSDSVPGQNIAIVVACSGLPFLVFAISMIVIAYLGIKKIFDKHPQLHIQKSFIQTQCNVTEKIDMKFGDGFSFKWTPILGVNYVFNNSSNSTITKAYCVDGYYSTKSSHSRSRVCSFLDGYKVGEIYKCYIDPNQSNLCFLSTLFLLTNSTAKKNFQISLFVRYY